MPQIPISQVSARTGRTQSEINVSGVNADAFGGQIGAANYRSGQAGMEAAGEFLDIATQEAARKRKEDVANLVAQNDFAKTEMELQSKVPADGKGYHDMTIESYRNMVEDTANKIDNDRTRQDYKTKMYDELPTLSHRAAEFEVKAGQANSVLQANSSLDALQNKVFIDPSLYDQYVTQGQEVINSRPGIPAEKRAVMADKWKNDSANRRFEGMLTRATTVADLDTMSAELAGIGADKRDWTKEFDPNQFKTMADAIGTRRKTIETQLNANAEAALAGIEERQKSNPTLTSSEDLQAMQQAVKQATKPDIIRRGARIMANDQQIRTEQALPPTELRARLNATAGSPGAAYPDLPPEVSTIIDGASNRWGIDVGYLGGNVKREYGKYLQKPKPVTDQQFAPHPTGEGVDLRNMRSDVVDGLTLAGQGFGAPLMVTKGSDLVGGTKGTGVEVSTIGMAPADKAKLVSSLVDGGFTGFVESPNALRVDFRQAVPQTFGTKASDGSIIGGMGYLSPEVYQALKDKGFAGGASSEIVKRKAQAGGPAIDYTKPTGIQDNGTATSSAMGINQFTKGTWLEVMHNQDFTQTMGLDLKGKTDAELLDMRGNPNLSINAAAFYAKQNKHTMEAALGRPVNDAELYMAHFLGTGGAVALLNGYKNSPMQSAADLLPNAADANDPVFYDKDGKALTVMQVYNNISNSFTLEPSRVAFESNQLRKTMLDNTDKSLRDDPMGHAAQVGSHIVLPLDQPGAFAARGNTAMSVADYNNVPYSEMKPFTPDEMNYLKKQIDSDNSDTTLGVMANIATMNKTMAKAALEQIKEKDPVFAQAGYLYNEGSASVASDIIRGRKRLKENPAIKQQMGIADDSKEINDAFTMATGIALNGLDGARRQAIQDSALAYYVEQASNNGAQKFDKSKYLDAVQTVMGGTKGAPAFDVVNGTTTSMPSGVKAADLEGALSAMTVQDYVAMSATGQPPRYADGGVVNPFDIRHEVTLHALGGGQYKMKLSNGSELTTGDMGADGRAVAYIFAPDAKRIRALAATPAATSRRNNFGGFYAAKVGAAPR